MSPLSTAAAAAATGADETEVDLSRDRGLSEAAVGAQLGLEHHVSRLRASSSRAAATAAQAQHLLPDISHGGSGPACSPTTACNPQLQYEHAQQQQQLHPAASMQQDDAPGATWSQQQEEGAWGTGGVSESRHMRYRGSEGDGDAILSLHPEELTLPRLYSRAQPNNARQAPAPHQGREEEQGHDDEVLRLAEGDDGVDAHRASSSRASQGGSTIDESSLALAIQRARAWLSTHYADL